jgi:hypothetical protein
MALTRKDLEYLTKTDAKEIDKWFNNYDQKAQAGTSKHFVGNYIKGPLVLTANNPAQETPEVFFENCYFESGINLASSYYKNKIQSSNCTFEGAVNITNSFSDADIEFGGCEFHIHFMVIESKLKSLLFECSCPVFRIDGSTIEQCFIYSEKYHEAPRRIERLTIDFRSTFGSISIGNIDIGWMEFYNSISKDTELLIREVKFQHLLFRDMLNNGKVRLIKLEPLNNPSTRAEFSMSACNAGKCEFVNLDFRKLHFLHFESVYLIDCTFVNVIWPKNFDLTPYSMEASALLDRKETYRQLKYSYSKQGDSILEHKFHGLEMDK